jgi:preprotein translocase subunit SecF
MRLFKNAHYDFLSQRKKAYVLSGILLAAGILSLILHGGLRQGVEFTGGTKFQVEFTEPTSVADVRDAIGAAGLEGAQIQKFGGSNEYAIRVATFSESGGQRVSEEVTEALDSAYGEGAWEMRRRSAVGPKVGSELREKALIAILLSFALTLVYLAFRFEWRFGVAAIVATAHDITLTFGFLSILNIEITLATVAAILTILGYSLNDTIVVFDRIRENLKKRRKESYADIINSSINETLPRTVLTSGTTLMTLLSLVFLGGSVIQPFALVMILGVVIGTYSSIFVASPVLLELADWSRNREKRRSAAPAKAG